MIDLTPLERRITRLENIGPRAQIILDNPSPFTRTGSGILLRHASQLSVAVGAAAMSLIDLNTVNTGSGQLYDIKIQVDTDTADTGAGLAIFNTGKSDNIYLCIQGKEGAASTPTGIGIDLNKQVTTSDEGDDQMAGYGIQIFDHSTTNQGIDGPVGIFLNKVGDENSQHNLLKFNAQRYAMRLIVDHGSGYDAAEPLVMVITEGGSTNDWWIRADGSQVFANQLGLYFNMTSGNAGQILGTSIDTLRLKTGTGGLDVIDNSASNQILLLRDGGELGLVDGITAPSALAGFAFLYVDTSDGDLKVKFGDGTTKTLATDT